MNNLLLVLDENCKVYIEKSEAIGFLTLFSY